MQEGILLKNSSGRQGRNGGWQIYTNRKLKEMRTHKKSSGRGNKWIPFCQCFAAHLIPCSSPTVRWQECCLIDTMIDGSSSKFDVNALLVNPNSFTFAIVSPLTPKPSKNSSRSGAVVAPGGCCCHTVKEKNPHISKGLIEQQHRLLAEKYGIQMTDAD